VKRWARCSVIRNQAFCDAIHSFACHFCLFLEMKTMISEYMWSSYLIRGMRFLIHVPTGLECVQLYPLRKESKSTTSDSDFNVGSHTFCSCISHSVLRVLGCCHVSLDLPACLYGT
jgi:hypothetical protein